MASPGVKDRTPEVVADGRHPVGHLRRLLDGRRAEIREELFTVLADPVFRLDPGAPTAVYRERVLACCQELADRGFGSAAYPPLAGGSSDPFLAITRFETLAFHDLSLLVKFGVQFGLFGGSILQLGTSGHHERYLPAVARLQLAGCFAMTETAHGSNVRDIQTTATYDAATGEFEVHTPVPEARKDYIGNAALHGHMATVFAQLRVAGAEHGVHALLVPLRDEAGRALPGVRIEDCGEKAGLNGVDNGRITFDRVRVPRENLLDRFARVSAEGVYSSDIESPSRRFFTMLGTLVAGRISIACASCSVAKTALAVALPYAAERRQFGPDDGPEVPILTYLDVQRKLLPDLALTVALDAALEQLVTDFASGGEAREVETAAAGLKAIASEHALRVLQAAREVCGGAGYMAENRIGLLRADADIFTTFEGANPVLLQLVAKSLLGGLREQFEDTGFLGLARYIGGRASTVITELNPVITRRTDPDHLRDPDFHLAALEYREERLLATAARRIKARMDDGASGFAALNDCQDHVIAQARAHVETAMLRAMADKLAGAGSAITVGAADAIDLLKRLQVLAGLSLIERDRGWFLEANYLEAGKSKAIRAQVNELCRELAPEAVDVVRAFGIPDVILAAPIAVNPNGGGPRSDRSAPARVGRSA